MRKGIHEDGRLREKNVRIELFNKFGKRKLVKTAHNLILTDGQEIAAERLGGTGTQDYLQCIALGTSSTGPLVSQTDLQGSELGRVTTVNTNIVGNEDTERFIGTFGAGVGTGTIEEAVLADANAVSGSRKCFSRVLTGTVVKGSGDTLTVTWEIQNT